MSRRTDLFDILSLWSSVMLSHFPNIFNAEKVLHLVSLRESILALASSPSRIALDRAILVRGGVEQAAVDHAIEVAIVRRVRRGVHPCRTQTPRAHAARCRAPAVEEDGQQYSRRFGAMSSWNRASGSPTNGSEPA